MDNQPNNLSQQNPQHTPFKYVLYGLEFLIPLFLLALIFFLLNYLNILRFGSVFPFLSFLPHLPSSQISITAPSTTTKIKGTPKPAYNYTLENGYNAFDSFVNDVLQQPLKPLTRDREKTTLQSNTNFGWVSPDASESATISYIPNTNSVGELNIFIVPNTISQQPLSQEFAVSEIKKYFTVTQLSSLKCSTLPNKFIGCEQFSKNKDHKDGVGIIANTVSSQSSATYFLFSCRIFPAYPRYGQVVSCIPSQHK